MILLSGASQSERLKQWVKFISEQTRLSEEEILEWPASYLFRTIQEISKQDFSQPELKFRPLYVLKVPPRDRDYYDFNEVKQIVAKELGKWYRRTAEEMLSDPELSVLVDQDAADIMKSMEMEGLVTRMDDGNYKLTEAGLKWRDSLRGKVEFSDLPERRMPINFTKHETIKP